MDRRTYCRNDWRFLFNTKRGYRWKIKKSDLTKFTKDCVYTHEKAVKLECISEDIMRNQIGKELINDNQNILLEVLKRFAKYARENINIDLDYS